ncbi:MAG: flagellar basal body-associated FliL family protein [bacterium]
MAEKEHKKEAEEETAEGEEKPKKEKKDMGGLIKVLGMVALVLVLIIVVIFVASNVAKKSIAPPDEEFEPEKVEKEEAHAEAEKPLHDNYIGDFTAKLADVEEAHYVKITDLALKYDPIKYKLLAAELGERDSEIKDAINTILISKTSEVNSVKGKEELREEIKEKINSMLIEGQIPEVLFQVIVQ